MSWYVRKYLQGLNIDLANLDPILTIATAKSANDAKDNWKDILFGHIP